MTIVVRASSPPERNKNYHEGYIAAQDMFDKQYETDRDFLIGFRTRIDQLLLTYSTKQLTE